MYCWVCCIIIVLVWVLICYMIVTLIIVQSNVILYCCITFDFCIRREGCKIPVAYYVSAHRGHRRCLGDSPAYLGRPDPLSCKWIGRQFEWGLARRNWPSFCGAGVRPRLGPHSLRQQWKATDVCRPIRWARFGSVDVRLWKDEVSTIVRRRTLYGR